MSEFPRAARIYLTVLMAAGGLSLVWALLHLRSVPLLTILFFVGLCVVADRVRVPIGAKTSPSASSASISLGAGAMFLTLLQTSAPVATVVVALASLASCHRDPKQRLRDLVNAAVMVLAVGVAGKLMQALSVEPKWLSVAALASAAHIGRDVETVAGFLTVVLVHFFVNSFCVAGILALVSGGRVIRVWRDAFLWALPAHLTSGSVALLTCVLVHAAVQAWWVTLLLGLAALPIPVMAVLGFRYRHQWEEENAARLDEQKAHIQELTASKSALEEMHSATVEAFALAIDAKDQYTQEHIQRVKLISVALARELDLPPEEIRAIETGAALHDIGKIAIPEHILNKPGRLTGEEFALIQRHPDLGARILEPVRFPAAVVEAVRSHHEKWVGGGYPDNLKGESIPLAGRILAVADVYDALTSDRPYRAGWTHERACGLIAEESGRHFDPRIVEAFDRVMAAQPDLCAGSEAVRRSARERSALVRRIHRPSHEFLVVSEIELLLAGASGVTELGQEIAEKICTLFRASACLLLLEGEDGTLRVRSAAGANAVYFQGASADRAGGPTRRVWETGDPFLGEYDTTELLINATVGEWTTLGAAMAVALETGERRFGVACVYHRDLDAFDMEDIGDLRTLCTQISAGLAGARERERVRRAWSRGNMDLCEADELRERMVRELAWARSEGRQLSLLRVVAAPGSADIAADVRRCLRWGDLVGRWTDGALLLVLSGTDASGARAVAHGLEGAVPAAAQPLTLDAATFPADAADLDALLAALDPPTPAAAPLRLAA